MTTETTIVFVTVVGLRFLLPLFIPRWPLPAVLACLVLDGIDQSIFQAFGFDPPGYQNYDKAMDLFYLSIAFLSSLQNWTHSGAVGISRFLFFYRMVGVMAFEITGVRTILLIFPNTFEYFFIAYEAVRLRWDPRRFSRHFWIVTAACIWIFIKLPQEYWIHVAQLDFTDTWQEVPWFPPLVVSAVLVGLAVLWFVVRPRLLPPDHAWRVAADPLPEEMATAAQRDAWTAAHVRIWSWSTLEKVVLIGLLSTIYARILPGLEVSDLRMFVGIAAYVVANVAISLVVARRVGSREGLAAAFGSRVLVNLGLVLVARILLGGSALDESATVFFVLLLSLLVTMHDRFSPVAAVRAEHDERDPAPAARAAA
ncbi:hypothetical protein GCM10023168_37020 [Fodinibacter luteus]|uniref:Uncharacterized protein n=1 Tax=Fodinibacter luteus TaxID=552064 RepID=A0ABP8KRX4_9MICO